MSPLVMLSQHLVYLVLTSVIALVVMQAPDTLDKVMRALSVVRCITALDNIAIMGCCFLCGGILLAVKNSMGSCTTTARVDPLLTEADEPEEDMPTPSEARNFFQRICEAVTPAATQAVKVSIVSLSVCEFSGFFYCRSVPSSFYQQCLGAAKQLISQWF